jgi:hypothetical protein
MMDKSLFIDENHAAAILRTFFFFFFSFLRRLWTFLNSVLNFSLSNAKTNHHGDLCLLCFEPLDENLQVIDNLPRVVEDDPVVGWDRPHGGPVVCIELLENSIHFLRSATSRRHFSSFQATKPNILRLYFRLLILLFFSMILLLPLKQLQWFRQYLAAHHAASALAQRLCSAVMRIEEDLMNSWGWGLRMCEEEREWVFYYYYYY